MKTEKKWDAGELKRRIAARHPLAKAWAVANEVGAASGTWGKAGSIDSVAVCLSAPRDFAVHGFEVKVSRSDWLSELNNPKKNAIAIQEVDYWWIVAPSTEIVPVDELPDKWGLYTCSGRGLRVTKRAKRIKPAGEPFSRAFVVSLLWKFSTQETAADKEIQAAKHGEYQRGFNAAKRRVEQDAKWDAEAFEVLKREKAAFELASGCRLTEYNAGRIGDLTRCLLEQGPTWDLIGRMATVRQVAERVAGTIKSFEDDLRERAAGLVKPETEVVDGG
jgi:hypothetical protein